MAVRRGKAARIAAPIHTGWVTCPHVAAAPGGQPADTGRSTPATRPRRYVTLEGMRGIGAIYVVLFHGEALFGAAAPQSAYLGVDFFFVLSGFIVAHVYAGPLELGLPPATFLRSRLLRLYPVYILGTLSGIALAAWSLLAGHSVALWRYTQPLVSLPYALCLLPSPASDAMFPLDIPAWSLLLEFVVNVGYAVRWLRSTRALLAVTAVSAAVLVAALLARGNLNAGWSKETAVLGLARICFSFPLGVLAYRSPWRIRMPAWSWAVPVVALAALVYAAPTGPARIAFDLAFIAVVSPALVLAGAAGNPANPRLQQIFVSLGAMSYPLYALHYPALMAVTGTVARHVPAGPPRVAAAILVLAGLVAMAWYVSVLDTGLRAAITQRRRPAFPAIRRAGPGALHG